MPDGISFKLDGSPNHQTEERLVLTSGRLSKVVRLHDYDEIFVYPGLYEDVVQVKLECASPRMCSLLLRDLSERLGAHVSQARILDLGAGNGVLGEILRGLGVEALVGFDSRVSAADAAKRDRPDVYDDYIVGSTCTTLSRNLRANRVNVILASGSVGEGHISVNDFVDLLLSSDGDCLFGLTVPPSEAASLDEKVSDWNSRNAADGHIDLVVERSFRHRLAMTGRPIWYRAVGGVLRR